MHLKNKCKFSGEQQVQYTCRISNCKKKHDNLNNLEAKRCMIGHAVKTSEVKSYIDNLHEETKSKSTEKKSHAPKLQNLNITQVRQENVYSVPRKRLKFN